MNKLDTISSALRKAIAYKQRDNHFHLNTNVLMNNILFEIRNILIPYKDDPKVKKCIYIAKDISNIHTGKFKLSTRRETKERKTYLKKLLIFRLTEIYNKLLDEMIFIKD